MKNKFAYHAFATAASVAALSVMFPGPANALDATGYVTLVANDANTKSSFNSAGNWSSGAKPAAGQHYLVNGGLLLRSPASSFSTPFAGDSLTLAGNARIALKSYSGSVLSANWIMYDAEILHNSYNDNDDPWKITIAGTMEVHGTSSGPTTIHLQERATEVVTVAAPLTGDATAFLMANTASSRDSSLSRIAFTGDNTAYGGRFEFKNSSSSGKAYGFLEFSGETSAGVTGDPSEGVPFLTVTDTTAKPVVELNNVHMDSDFTIECNNANARIDIAGTNSIFGAEVAGTSAGIPVNVNGDTVLCSPSPLTIHFGEDGMFLAKILSDGTSLGSTIAAGSTLTLSGAKLPVRVDGVIPHTNSAFSATILKIPTSVMEITAEDIDLYGDDFGLMTVEVTVADGIQTVTLKAGNVVYYSVPNTESGWGNWAAYNQAAQYWSDGEPVHDDADYLINYDVPAGCDLLRGCQAVFAGRSLTFAEGGRLVLKGSTANPDVIEDLRMFPGSIVQTGDNNASLNALSGSLKVAGRADDDPVLFKNYSGGTMNLMSVLSGEGPVQFVSDKAGTKFPVVLSGSSSSYTGQMEFYGANAGRNMSVTINDEANFGGNPSVFNPAQTYFNCRVELIVKNDVTIDDSNRGITFVLPTAVTGARNVDDIFNVGEGATLALKVPMVVNTDIVKTGTGILGIGGSISGSHSNIAVSAGYVMPLSGTASRAFRYTMADGAGIAVDIDQEDEDILADGLYIEDASHLTLSGGTLRILLKGTVAREYGSRKLAVLNVPSEMAAEVSAAIGGEATVTDKDSGLTRTCAVSYEELDGGRTRFSATMGMPGFRLIVR